MNNKLERLRTLLARINIHASVRELENHLILLEELFLWNKNINLTAIRVLEEAMEKHIVDSLTLFPWLQNSNFLLDIGSGAGFPSIPLKIACPKIQVYSVEASRKKVHFQRHIARRLELEGFKIIHSRAEDLKKAVSDLPVFDLVVSRAVTSLGEFLHLAHPFVSESGCVIAMRGPVEEDDQGTAGGEVSLELCDVRSFRLPVSGSLRKLLIYKKSL